MVLSCCLFKISQHSLMVVFVQHCKIVLSTSMAYGCCLFVILLCNVELIIILVRDTNVEKGFDMVGIPQSLVPQFKVRVVVSLVRFFAEIVNQSVSESRDSPHRSCAYPKVRSSKGRAVLGFGVARCKWIFDQMSFLMEKE